MSIELCDNRAEWLRSQEFLQSWDWGEFQSAVGHAPIRLQSLQDGKVAGQLQGFVHDLGWGIRYLYAPRCLEEHLDLQALGDFLKKEGIAFLRLEPQQDRSSLKAISYKLKAVNNRQPQHTLLVDLTKTEEEILAGMHAKTRYNIHLAEKKDLTISQEKNADVFWKLNQETTARDAFKSHGKEYYTELLKLPIAHQLTAFQDGVAIASHILIISGDTCTYLHGASGNTGRNLMAPYLLQWEGMKLGRSLGCARYDMWGVAPQKKQGDGTVTCFHNYCWDSTHPWTGITRFKAGFGGAPHAYPNAVDIILQPMKYRLYQLVRRIKGMV